MCGGRDVVLEVHLKPQAPSGNGGDTMEGAVH